MTETNKTVTAGNKAKIISLLGKGLNPTVVATAVGVSDSYISQLLANTEFAQEVTSLRMQSLEAHTARDSKIDDLEDLMLDKMKDLLPYLVKPGEVMRAFKTLNEAKRRGLDPTEQAANTSSTTIINLTLPKTIVSDFAVNGLGQVIEAEHHLPDGTTQQQSLVTIQSDSIKDLLDKNPKQIEER